jgi:hypothetical protein
LKWSVLTLNVSYYSSVNRFCTHVWWIKFINAIKSDYIVTRGKFLFENVYDHEQSVYSIAIKQTKTRIYVYYFIIITIMLYFV